MKKKNKARTPYGRFNRPPQGKQQRHSKPSLTTAKRGWKANTRLPISFGVGYDDITPRKKCTAKGWPISRSPLRLSLYRFATE
ncbi:hypothetical protein CDAR_513991 [Caerostris darwini]|uniref:Uncharacterized protein n=1 Tax=Caerostris darwini TaxID=1538125 RepID=A0AAV4TAL1_9ARAC|nr:hypothetical protein CDAR_513991 [Caerostris darwini]